MTRFSVLVWCLLAAGCSSSTPSGSAGGAGRADELREVGGLITAHSAKGRKTAPTPSELAEYEQAFPLGVKILRSGEVVGVWGAKPLGEEAVAAGQSGTDVLAFEKKVPAEGGGVL